MRRSSGGELAVGESKHGLCDMSAANVRLGGFTGSGG